MQGRVCAARQPLHSPRRPCHRNGARSRRPSGGLARVVARPSRRRPGTRSRRSFTHPVRAPVEPTPMGGDDLPTTRPRARGRTWSGRRRAVLGCHPSQAGSNGSSILSGEAVARSTMCGLGTPVALEPFGVRPAATSSLSYGAGDHRIRREVDGSVSGCAPAGAHPDTVSAPGGGRWAPSPSTSRRQVDPWPGRSGGNAQGDPRV